MTLRLVLTMSVAALASACAGHSTATRPVSEAHPGWGEPTAQTRQTRHDACASGTAEVDDIRLLRTITVVTAEPVYAPGHSDLSRSDDRISGTKIVFRQPDGVSPGRMTHILRCHSMQALLGVVDTLPDDPFSLPGTWVGIKVRPEAGNYAATVEADSTAHNLELVARAKAFAKAKSARSDHSPW
jgi:hypothetical protein